MPVNIEIKARVKDFEAARARAQALSDSPVQIIPQTDTFFRTTTGRFKLRVFAADRAQLVYYDRPDLEGPKRSEYFIFDTDEPDHLLRVMSRALGVRGVVKKTRYLYLVDQTRIHLDDVDGLGRFIELEVVLRDGQTDEQGQKLAQDLMEKLQIAREDLIDGAYMDLMEI